MTKLKCKRCTHEWWPRSDKPPVLCPSCKSKYWQKERQSEKERKSGKG